MVVRFGIALGLLVVGAALACGDDIDGFGRTLDDAKIDARQNALERIEANLAKHEPPLNGWRPALADIEGFVEGPGRAGAVFELPGVQYQYRWILPVRMPSEDEMVLRDRRARRQQGASLAVLIVIAAMTGWRWGSRRS